MHNNKTPRPAYLDFVRPVGIALGAAIVTGFAAYSCSSTHTPENAAGPAAEQTNFAPAAGQTVAIDVPAREPVLRVRDSQTVDFIVRFEDGIEAVDACLENPEDLETARSIFNDWAKTEPGLSDLTLKEVTYSGELILIWDSGIRRPLLVPEVQERIKALTSLPIVRYADPDHTVQPQRKPG